MELKLWKRFNGVSVMWDKVRIHYWLIAKMNESLTTKGKKHKYFLTSYMLNTETAMHTEKPKFTIFAKLRFNSGQNV